MEYINRDLQKQIVKWFYKNKIIFILGPRQVGKTTLVLHLLSEYGNKENYYNCELLNIKQLLESKDPYLFKNLIGDAKFIVLDEAHTVNEIGKMLKLIHDTTPDLQIIATGSSSFQLKNRSDEPLTGRAYDFLLFPFSLTEISRKITKVELLSKVETILRFGSYPELFNKGEEESKIYLDNLTSRYLYRDVLEFETIKKSDKILRLLQLLAFQIGSEVSITELATKLGINRGTVERYLDLLEKAYVIFRLKAYNRNLRNEISKKEKFFFYDLGVRNSLISQYNPLELRNDVGALWENFCVIELIKKSINSGEKKNFYFWRTIQGKEIDFIEEADGKLVTYEFKWKNKKTKKPAEFFNEYKTSDYIVLTKDDILKFLL